MVAKFFKVRQAGIGNSLSANRQFAELAEQPNAGQSDVGCRFAEQNQRSHLPWLIFIHFNLGPRLPKSDKGFAPIDRRLSSGFLRLAGDRRYDCEQNEPDDSQQHGVSPPQREEKFREAFSPFGDAAVTAITAGILALISMGAK
jgi:hypothetical protein